MGHTAAAPALGLTKANAVERAQVVFAARDIEFLDWKGDVLAVAVTEKDLSKGPDSKFENAILKNLDAQLGGLLSETAAEEDFGGKAGQSVVLRLQGQGFKRVALIGFVGHSAAHLQGLGESVASVAKAAQASSCAIVLASPSGVIQDEFKLSAAAAIASGTVLGLYEDGRYKSEWKKVHLKQVDLIGFGSGPEVDQKLEYANHLSSGVIFGRDLVNSPANVLTPAVLAEEASKIASTYSDVFTATILDAEKCKELKMGAYLAVAAASANPPRFIHLCYKPIDGNVNRKLAIVGKGLTFDSIELMKWDMGGSAAVFGAAKALGQIKPPGVEVHFIAAACENMISGTGMRPGDIVTASNGKTIEIDNTDAEGRLTLADALVYACNQGVDKIIDLATLTGAIRVALGPSIAGKLNRILPSYSHWIFTPADELAREFVAASEVSGEKFWRLPMEESYWESMQSSVADMLNTGPMQPKGGAITATLFLKQFVDEKVQWMHIDIAGTVWNHKKRAATGFGVSTLVEWVLKNSSS